MEKFKITDAHIKLAKAMYVSWDDCEFGAPSIDCKRPYGNSDVVGDILRILGLPYDDEEENESLRDYAIKIHESMKTALQIFLCTGSFIAGTYEMKDQYNSRSWVKIS